MWGVGAILLGAFFALLLIGSLSTKKTGEWRYRAEKPFFLAIAAAVTIVVALSVGLFGILPPTSVRPNGQAVFLRWNDGAQAALAYLDSIIRKDAWTDWKLTLLSNGLALALVWRVWAVGAAAMIGGYMTFDALLPLQERYRVNMRLLRGRALCVGYDAIVKAKAETRVQLDPYWDKRRFHLMIAPGVKISFAQEKTGFIALGAPGSGKTVWLRNFITQIINRSNHIHQLIESGVDPRILPLMPDRAILVDVQGDLTEDFPTEDFIHLAPHDVGYRDGKRIGYAWDIGKDIVGEPSAMDFACSLIVAPDGENKNFFESAQQILWTLVMWLQKNKGTNWGWSDVADVISTTPSEMRKKLVEISQIAANLITFEGAGEVNPSRTTANYIQILSSATAKIIKPLSTAWGNAPKNYRISLTEWLANDNHPKRFLILQMSDKVGEISSAWTQAAMTIMAKFVKSGLSNNQRGVPERRLWFLCDEAKQYMKNDANIKTVIEVGRKKGACVALLAQVAQQFGECWSKEEMITLLAMIQTKLFFKTATGEAATAYADNEIGRCDWMVTQRTANFGSSGAGGSVSPNYRDEWCVHPGWFDEALGFLPGRKPKGIYMAWAAPKHLFRFEIPFPNWHKVRADYVFADWVISNDHQKPGNATSHPVEKVGEMAARLRGEAAAIIPSISGNEPKKPASDAPVGEIPERSDEIKRLSGDGKRVEAVG